MPNHSNSAQRSSSPRRLLGARLRIALSAIAVAASFAAGLVTQDAAPTPVSVPASRQADRVAVLTMHGPIDSITSMSMQRRLATAAAGGADAIVIEIDSPGGEVGAVLEITKAIKESPIKNTVAWINSDAYSGGAIVALACRQIVTSSAASFGDALPVIPGLGGVQRATEVIPPEKILPPLLSEVADSARRNGYDEYLVQAVVTDGIELWAVRDTQSGGWLYINEAEYRALFDGEPVRGRPVLTSVHTGVAVEEGRARALSPQNDPTPSESESGEAAPSTAESETPETSPSAPDEAPADSDSDTDTEPDASESDPDADQPTIPAGDRFRPANDEISRLIDLARDQEGMLVDPETASQRPVITPGLRGRFIDPVYISDGSGPIVMRHDQMARFGLSSAIITTDEQLKAYFGATELVRLDRSWSESLVAVMTSFWVRGLLIVVFLLAMFLEMTSPGIAVPGAVAAVALVALIAPPMLIGMAGWWEVLAIVLGILALAMEIFVLPGFGIFGIAGLLLLFGGLIGTFVPDSPFPGAGGASGSMLYGLVTVTLATCTAGVGMYFIGKHAGSLPIFNRLILHDADPDADAAPGLVDLMGGSGTTVRMGQVGSVLTPLRPSGTAEFGEEIVDVVSELGYIEPGTSVRVIEVSEYRVLVEPAPGVGEEEDRA